VLLIAESVHGLPEAVMQEGVNLSLSNQGFDGFTLEHLNVVGDGADGIGRENEEAAVDPAAFAWGFSWKE